MTKQERNSVIAVTLNLKNIKTVYDYYDIQDLNTRAKRAWERGNNSGCNKCLDKMTKKYNAYYLAAEKIAAQNNWVLDAPGLYWTIDFKKEG